MIDSLWRLKGSNQLPVGVSDEIVLNRLEAFLSNQKKSGIEKNSSSIIFRSPLWMRIFTPNWLALTVFDQGAFSIDAGPQGRYLRYNLQALHLMIFCLVAAMIVFAFIGADEGIVVGAKYAAFALIWIYGGNLALAWIRIPRAIKGAVNGA